MTDVDLDLEPCPGCGRDIDCMLSVCPHCKYDLTGTTPATKPKKPPKKRKPTGEQEEGEISPLKEEPRLVRRHPGVGMLCIFVPALGRMGRPPIDFPAIHWRRGQEPTDENLLEWAETLRESWHLPEPRGAGDSQGWLSNHAIGYLACWADGEHDDPLRANWKRVVELLGGDDCP